MAIFFVVDYNYIGLTVFIASEFLCFTGANYNKCCYGTYGPGTGNIISALSCSYDKTVLDCERKELNYTCDHSNDVGVRCFGKCLVTVIYMVRVYVSVVYV